MRWQPGYQVISSRDGALRVLELISGNVIRINQRNVREIPENKPYDEINPSNDKPIDYINPAVNSIPVVEESHLPTRIPKCPIQPRNGQLRDYANTAPIPVASAVIAVESFFLFPSDDWSSKSNTTIKGHHYTQQLNE
jgi:hypothetical protein